MSRWKKKRKRWIDNHARLCNQKGCNARCAGRSTSNNLPGSTTRRIYSKDDKPYSIQTAPRVFSLTDNPEETMAFFLDFAKEIDRHQYGTHFFVDSSKVELVSVDALIYLIAILQNDKQNNYLHYKFSGNFPESEAARKVYTESGFTDYVDSRMKILPVSNDKMRIICGDNNNPQSAKELSGFVMESLDKDKKEILPLQKVLIELMSNVFHHAYEKNSFLAKKWYMYAEHVDDQVRCVFVDTGFGIAKTARKKINESLRLKLGIQVDDAKIIQSIFNSDFRTYRTSTNEDYRGNGLVSVRDNVKDKLFDDFQVFSGRGRCIISKKNDALEVISYGYSSKLYGTLYQFIIR